MTIGDDDDQYRVARTPVGRRSGHRLVALGAVAIGALAVVLSAAFMERGGTSPGSTTGPSRVAFLEGSPSSETPASSGSRSTAAGSSAPATTVRPDPPRPPSSSEANLAPRSSPGALPDFADVPLPGSPEIVLFQRVGDDINLLGWRPGEPDLTTKQAVHGAARGFTESDSLQVDLSTDGSLLLVHGGPGTVDGPDTFRVFRLQGTSGREIWHSTSLGSGLGAVFVSSGQLLIESNAPLLRNRGWTIVDLSAGKAVVHNIDLPPIPTPAPSASGALGGAIFYYVPLAVSADGRWLYAMSAHASRPLYRPAYRISIATGRAEAIDTFPITGTARIVSPVVDRRTGRFLSAGPGSMLTGAGFVEAWSAGADAPDFHIDLGDLFWAAWTDDGGVITADYDRLPGPFTFRVLSLTATGKVDTTFLTADADNAALMGVENGFAAAYVTWNGTGRRELVAIRLSDGASSGVRVSEPDGLLFSPGLRP